MQVAVLRDTKPRRRRSRAVTLLFLPVLVVVWLVGWSLYWIGGKKDRERLGKKMERKEDHVTLIPASAVEQENENVEMPERRAN
jgi:hypothetical protein